jgi:DnaJ-class molecular chaperone
VEPSATAAQIRAAYRAKAKSFHPDVSKASDASARFAEISLAYEVLSDRARRSEYDLSLARPGRSRKRENPQDGAAHYTWTNIATEQARAERASSEFDEMYDAYFRPHKPAE